VSPEEYKAIREKLALSQGELAARLGVTRKTINARETGATRITEEAALAIRAQMDFFSTNDQIHP
jgi:DNA-binding XRE family transcriptional regulator